MNNKYIALTAMYRYGILFMEDKPSDEQIKNILTTTNPHTVIPGSKFFVKKALNDNFGIKNELDMKNVINSLTNALFESVIYNMFIDMFLQYNSDFINFDIDKAKEFFENNLQQNLYLKKILSVLNDYEIINNDTTFENELINNYLLTYFNEENKSILEEFLDIFEQNKFLLPYTKFSNSAYHLSRIISIISDAYLSNFISEETTQNYLNYYGELTISLFDNWETYLFSAIFGKQMATNARGTFIIDSDDYIKSCYKLTAHPKNILNLIDFWKESDVTIFSKLMEEKYGLSMEEEEDLKNKIPLAFLDNTILPLFKKYGLEYIFDYSICNIYYTVYCKKNASSSTDHLMMGYELEDLKIDYDKSEIPIMARSKKLLITNKKIYFVEKKWFSKKLHIFNWSDNLNFSYKLGKLEDIYFMVNDKIIFTLPRNYKKYGLGYIADSMLSREEVIKNYGEDMNNAVLAFSELKQILSK